LEKESNDVERVNAVVINVGSEASLRKLGRTWQVSMNLAFVNMHSNSRKARKELQEFVER
jgi:hypothetical protein